MVDLKMLEEKTPILKEICSEKEVFWKNPDKTVSRMKECLMAYDSDGAVDAADNILGYEISPDVRDKLTRIRNAADEFDYRGALILTEALPSHP